ncbi:MAG TPA: HAMP domain-containing sensor histidine kinase [Acidimicrobiales bacterium]|nr:HAMP domain-containing sensor histidine kinase [Acidimicrobiales bacterium]
MAAVTTALIAVLYVAVGAILDVVVVGRMTHQVDHRLAGVLDDATSQSLPLGEVVRPPDRSQGRDLDDAPVLLWRVGARGDVTALSPGAPALPRRAWSPAAEMTASLSASRFRLAARRINSGWLVAGESLAEPGHVRGVLLVAEAAVAPVILLSIYLGSLVIGLKAAAPVERTRRRQLEFTADASHELRTPLSVIEAEVGLALSAPRLAPYYRSSLGRVAQEGRRLHEIVEDLLWLARFDAEPPPPGDEPVDLAPIAAACAERFEALAESRGLNLALEPDGAPGRAFVRAPPEWIDRLLGVLVDNACRYSPAGGTVSIAVGAVGARAFVVVEDDGPGIPGPERERLFDRFHRASDQPGGAGLGLAIADSVVSSTGGRWRIGESPSGGARMEVSWHRAGGTDSHSADQPRGSRRPGDGERPSSPGGPGASVENGHLPGRNPESAR